ncbi:MAG TPA: hypothetical protein EYN66_11935 [Myxococcales bacterium]|nr:hypothetical protein [Myxococcales bacterium]
MKVPKGKDVKQGISGSPGGTMLTGAGIDFYRLLTMRMGLQLPPMKLTRGPAMTTIVRRELGLKGNKDELLAQVEAIIHQINVEAGVDK